MKPKNTFEEKLARLEKIAAELETNSQGLENSIALFEEGVALSRELEKQLTDVKRRVEIITAGSGEPEKKPFEETGS
ncbi:MAG: exodeoxyribonuclease VII small subunit [Elusimicrobiaceae bacterium]|jgi:exodeoxyribonuclease VII small subunit